MSVSMGSTASQQSFQSTLSDPTAYSATAPPLPLYPCAETLSPHLELPPADLAPLLRHALLFAARHADLVLLRWLFALPDEIRRLLPLDAVDDEGCGLLTSAILGSAGREDREQCVRVLARSVGVESWDIAGWSPLHHAALLSTPSLISFLLTSGADPHAVTHKGLTPLDIITDLPTHHEQASLLTAAMTSPPMHPPPIVPFARSPSLPSASTFAHPAVPGLRRKPTSLPPSVARAQLQRRIENKRRLRAEKERWMAEVAEMAQVAPARLLERCWEDEDGEVDGEEEKLKRRTREGRRSSVREETGEAYYSSGESDESEEEDEDETYDPHEPPPYHTFLVFSLPTLPSLLDTLITAYAPNAHPVAWRAAPANAIYLFARFALYRCDDEWLEELIVGVVDKVEKSIYDNVDDLAYLAFWIYNTTLLLHLLRKDAGLEVACSELNLFVMIEELINAIHVFVIRFIERRVDGYLDQALLDHEPMSEEFAGLSFEGEWSFLKNLTGRGTTAKKAAERIVPRAKDIFASATGSPARAEFALDQPLMNGDGGRKRSQTSFQSVGSSPRAEASRPLSVSGLDGVSRSFSSTSSMHLSAQPPSQARRPLDEPQSSLAAASADASPRTITTFLTSALVILQLYEVNPAVICQAFGQCVYWMGCELFNRITTRRKYLCRSKAVQIRMNLTALEDWIRDSSLPVKIAKHLEPLNQLLQWLQTCSSLDDFDSLIVMISSLRSLNPLQMQRAVKDYRFEVNETRMSDECTQYLLQLQKDWDKRRATLQREVMEKERQRLEAYDDGEVADFNDFPLESRTLNPAQSEPATPVDDLFNSDVPLGQYNPPSAPESLGELLDSRFMLPFTLPSDVDLLAATPPKGAAFGLLLPPGSDGSATQYLPSLSLTSPRPSSRSSFASLRPLRYASRKHQSTRELPVEFVTWLDEEERAKAPRERRLGSNIDSLRSGSIAMEGSRSLERTPTDASRSHLSPDPHSQPLRRPSASQQDTLRSSDHNLSPQTADVDDFGALATDRNGSYHERDDSEQTISSHSRDASNTTIKRKPDRLSALVIDDAAYVPSASFDRGGADDETTPTATTASLSLPGGSAKNWFKSLPKRRGLKAFIGGGGGSS